MSPIKMTDQLFDQLNEESGGACVYCGGVQFGVEPDARKLKCEACGAYSVYGVEELMLMGKIEIIDADDDETPSPDLSIYNAYPDDDPDEEEGPSRQRPDNDDPGEKDPCKSCTALGCKDVDCGMPE